MLKQQILEVIEGTGHGKALIKPELEGSKESSVEVELPLLIISDSIVKDCLSLCIAIYRLPNLLVGVHEISLSIPEHSLHAVDGVPTPLEDLTGEGVNTLREQVSF